MTRCRATSGPTLLRPLHAIYAPSLIPIASTRLSHLWLWRCFVHPWTPAYFTIRVRNVLEAFTTVYVLTVNPPLNLFLHYHRFSTWYTYTAHFWLFLPVSCPVPQQYLFTTSWYRGKLSCKGQDVSETHATSDKSRTRSKRISIHTFTATLPHVRPQDQSHFLSPLSSPSYCHDHFATCVHWKIPALPD